MGSTPTFGFPYPENSDLVMDGARAIRDLALSVEGRVRRYRQSDRGRETFTNPPMPGSSRVRSVSFAGDGFTAGGVIPRISLTCGGDARVDGVSFVAHLLAVTLTGFEFELFPMSPPGPLNTLTGSSVFVDWIAVGVS